jgi:N-acetylmannosamine-6-phosphate 2-epimerase/N-acetylmannosamine kinase
MSDPATPFPAMQALKGRLIVSCQAPSGDPFANADLLALFAVTAVRGGAGGIRAEGFDSVRAIKDATRVPVVGIRKVLMPDGRIMITPTNEDAQGLVAAGADIVALDCTVRGRRSGALERLRWIRSNLGVPVWADIATVEEGVEAARAGADAVLSTLRGYTEDTTGVSEFEASFIAQLARAVSVPVVAEGRIDSAAHVQAALAAGAYAVVVGTAITRPEEITRRFASGMRPAPPPSRPAVGIDIGGTNIKSGLSKGDGVLLLPAAIPTPAAAGRAALLRTVTDLARQRIGDARSQGLHPAAVGVATAGWVDPRSGRVLYATESLRDWSGAEVKKTLEEALDLPVAVENDGNALAIAERTYGAGRGIDDFVCLTLGTGVGGGCFVAGKLNHGAHFLANGIGHMTVERDGQACTCGRSGCFEAYANAQALLRYADQGWTSADQVIAAANGGDPRARRALQAHAEWVALGCISLQNVFDPALIILSGGLVENNPLLLRLVDERVGLADRARSVRTMQIVASSLGYYGGVFGAIALAQEAVREPAG